MFAYSKITGRPIVGTLERIAARSDALLDTFRLDESGELVFDDSDNGMTVFWEETHTVTNERGETIFLDDRGEECAASLVELREEQALDVRVGT